MKIRPLHDFAEANALVLPLSADDLLDQENDLYDDNWIVSANDLFGSIDLPTNEYKAYPYLIA